MLSGQVILECYAQNPTANNPVVEQYISASEDIHNLEIIDGDFVQKLKTLNMIPGNLNITKSAKSDKAYCFTMRVQEQNVVFSALNERSFIQWIRALNIAISYLNPNQVTVILREIAQEEPTIKDGLDSICCFFIENYIDSARVRSIGKEQFRILIDQCFGQKDEAVADRMWWMLLQMVPVVNMGWIGVASAVKQEIDLNFANCIQSAAAELPYLRGETKCLLVPFIEKKTYRTLAESEKIYIEALAARSPYQFTLEMREIRLTVYRHRGHYVWEHGGDKNKHHPRNLLDKKGTKTYYYGNKPAVGDWITFKIESPFVVFPKAVIIGNALNTRALKSISISLSVDGDEFEDFAVIQDISMWSEEEQYFNLDKVMLSEHKMWMTEYKFLKLNVLSNWGNDQNLFYSFSVQFCSNQFKLPVSFRLAATS